MTSNLDGATLRVERALEETRQGIRIKAPKTKAGRRTISLPQRAVTMLRAYRLEQMQYRLQVGLDRIADDTPVFTTCEGERIWPTAKGLPSVTFHSLRHSHATMLIKEGMDVVTVSRRLGHSKASTTLDIYSHALKGSDGGAANVIDKLLGKGEGK